jgi:hypothetical protein
MGKKVLVAVAFLLTLVAVVSPESPYISAGQPARADYDTCIRVCNETWQKCTAECANWQTNKAECLERCDRAKQQCNCSN